MSLISAPWSQPQSLHVVGTQSKFNGRKERKMTKMERREERDGLKLYRILFL